MREMWRDVITRYDSRQPWREIVRECENENERYVVRYLLGFFPSSLFSTSPGITLLPHLVVKSWDRAWLCVCLFVLVCATAVSVCECSLLRYCSLPTADTLIFQDVQINF